MRKTENEMTVNGKVYDINMEKRTSRNGNDYISGKIVVATNKVETVEEDMRLVELRFNYIAPTYKNGNPNRSYTECQRLINSNKSILNVGLEDADYVRISTSLTLNEYYNMQSEEFVSFPQIGGMGGFINVGDGASLDAYKNVFQVDALCTGVKIHEADPDRGVDNTTVEVNAQIFDFFGNMMPVQFVVKSKGGMNYFANEAGISKNTPLFTHLTGYANVGTIIKKRTIESAFGEPYVEEVPHSVREWVVIAAKREPYILGQDITEEDIKTKTEDRELRLAEMKNSAIEYAKSQKNTSPMNAFAPTNTSTSSTASVGGDIPFKF